MKKRALTLIEIMIVIFLITLITGTIGYSMKGSMDKGKKFKTEQAQEQLRDLLLICLSEGTSPDKLESNAKHYLETSGLAKDPKGILKDGWGEEFTIKYDYNDKDFKISSSHTK
jgi:type II secretory pathway pseudopilin PulG